MWVIVKGGLGNQMFQAACGTALGLRFGVVPEFISLTSHASVRRNWELSCFGIPRTITHPLNSRMLHTAIAAMERLRLHRLARQGNIVIESSRRYSGLDMGTPPLLLSGYWQSPSFFEGHEEAVRALFKFPQLPIERTRILGANGDAAVAIHVRRGDFASNSRASAVHLVCTPDWYRSAWERVRRRIKECVGIVFSDDTDWCREHLRLPGNILFAEADSGPAWGHMALMSHCSHFIISNSSYSWWAAYLCAYKNKTVVAPAEWYRGLPTRTLNICPPEWVLL